MSKNASILEGNITRKFQPVEKIRVKNASSGESIWVPKDSVSLKSLSVSRNGFYYATAEGYTAYSEVTVNVSPETDINYEQIIRDYEYDASDIGGGIDISNIDSLDELNMVEGLEDVDLEDLENMLLDGVDTEEGSASEGIIGTDPETGNKVKVGKDTEGRLHEETLASSIVMVRAPSKTVYQNGESISLAGIQVCKVDANGNIIGTIPISELSYSPTVADWNGERVSIYDGERVPFTDGSLFYYREWTDDHPRFMQRWVTHNYEYATLAWLGSSTPTINLLLISRNGDATNSVREVYDGEWPRRTDTYSDRTYALQSNMGYSPRGIDFKYVMSVTRYADDTEAEWAGCGVYSGGFTSIGQFVDALYFGDHATDDYQTITVTWTSEDGESFSASFDITIKDPGGGKLNPGSSGGGSGNWEQEIESGQDP